MNSSPKNSQLSPVTGLHPTLNAFDAFFAGATTAPKKSKRVQILTSEQLARQKEATSRWQDRNRDAINAKKRLVRAGLQAIPSRDVLVHESKPVKVASARFATL